MDAFRYWMEVVGTGVDGAGVLIVVIGASYSTIRFVAELLRHVAEAYRRYRQALGRAILLGLEFLVAGISSGPWWWRRPWTTSSCSH